MTTEHTPGPWMVRNAGERRKTMIYTDRGSIAHVVKQGLPTDEPNALLIAAAPELLAALRWAEESLGGWPADAEQSKCRATVRSSIRKATGRMEGAR